MSSTLFFVNFVPCMNNLIILVDARVGGRRASSCSLLLFVILVACHFIYSIVDDAIILVFTFILVTSSAKSIEKYCKFTGNNKIV